MKILVLGYFGYVTNQIDGQTIKTRDIYSVLKQNCVENIDYFDTQSFKVSKINLIKMLWKVITADKIFYLPAQNNLKYLFPVIFALCKIFNTKLNYLVVGGWLYNFLKDKEIHRWMLKNIEGIYTETENLYVNLQNYDFNNIGKLHNFRIVEDFIDKTIKKDNFVNMVFMARVHPLKGVDVLFEIEKKLIALDKNNFSIHVYGPIFKDYEEEFSEKIKNSLIEYKGILEPEDVHKVLINYDMMLFPTKYYTEGFPGTILDAYIAMMPVVATNWLNACEFIEQGKTGYIVEFDNEQSFVNKTVDLVCQPNQIFDLHENICSKRKAYSADQAWEILEQIIYR